MFLAFLIHSFTFFYVLHLELLANADVIVDCGTIAAAAAILGYFETHIFLFYSLYGVKGEEKEGDWLVKCTFFYTLLYNHTPQIGHGTMAGTNDTHGLYGDFTVNTSSSLFSAVRVYMVEVHS